MAVITRTDLENAQRDVADLGAILNGAADRPNAGQDPGTVTTREGRVVYTISKLIADGQAVVEDRLTPIIYQTTVERENDLSNVTAGQTCFDKQDTNLYICLVEVTDPGPPEVTGNVWHQVSNLQLAASAGLDDLLRARSEVGRVSVTDFAFLRGRDKMFDADAYAKGHIKWPIADTPLNGLRTILGYSAWPATDAVLTRDVGYGCRVPFGSLKDATAAEHQIANGGPIEWLTDTLRHVFRNNNPGTVEGFYFPGYVDINGSYDKTIILRDCYIDTNYAKLSAVQKNNTDLYPCYVEYCTLRRFTSEGISLRGGHLAYSVIELSQGDGLKAGGNGNVIHGNLVRLLGQDVPTAHADCLQCFDVQNMDVTGNVFYMPGTGTHFSEGTYGSTQVLRLITENSAHVIKEVYVAGNLFVGGGFSVAVRSRFAGSLVENVVIANNMVAGTHGGHPLFVYGPITTEHWLVNNPGTIRNLIFQNRMTDGSPFATELPGVPQGGPDQNGIWHFSKPHASARFLEYGKRLGLLDWNGDLKPGVVNKT